jgi:phosphocarrier protein HPr
MQSRDGKGRDAGECKSIMGILMLAAPLGSVVRIITDGEREAECLKELSDLIVNKFGEGE